MSLEQTIRAEVLAAMSNNDVTQLELAEAVGFTAKHINQLLRGHISGPLSTWDPIVDWLCLEVEIWHAFGLPPRNRYVCNSCGRTVKRRSTKKWISSMCDQTGTMARLYIREQS